MTAVGVAEGSGAAVALGTRLGAAVAGGKEVGLGVTFAPQPARIKVRMTQNGKIRARFGFIAFPFFW